jgi:hypothetical protein
LTFVLEGGAQCVSSARWDLCGGYRVTGIPTATIRSFAFNVGRDSMSCHSKFELNLTVNAGEPSVRGIDQLTTNSGTTDTPFAVTSAWGAQLASLVSITR